jgi:hypothetical protein
VGLTLPVAERSCAGLSRRRLGCHPEAMVQYRDPGPIVFDAVIENPAGPTFVWSAAADETAFSLGAYSRR